MRLAVARDAGLDEPTIAAMLAGDTSDLLPHHRAALALAEAMMTQPTSLSDHAVAELHHHFTPDQLVELTLDVMKWNVQKIPVALGTDAWLRPGELTDLVFDEDGNWVR